MGKKSQKAKAEAQMQAQLIAQAMACQFAGAIAHRIVQIGGRLTPEIIARVSHPLGVRFQIEAMPAQRDARKKVKVKR